MANHGDVLAHLAARGLEPSTWESWLRLDRHEISLGEPHGRKRVKVVPGAEMPAIGRPGDAPIERGVSNEGNVSTFP
jgi:ferredoxin--NADP+ reductase